MTQIIGISGRKQSGKTTSVNYIHGHLLKQNLVVEDFKINETGDLVVTALFRDEQGNPYKDMGVLKLDQKNEAFENYASRSIWPIVKGYNFAEALKEVCMGLLGLTWDQCYGTDEQKNTPTNILWENVVGVMPENFQTACVDWRSYSHFFITDEPKTGAMTAREVMQILGSDILRKLNPNIWLDAVFNQIKDDSPSVAVIGDCRFKNEADAIKAHGGLLVRLLRDEHGSSHASETDLDNYEGWDLVIDNRNLTIQECNSKLLEFLLYKNVVKPLVSWIQ